MTHKILAPVAAGFLALAALPGIALGGSDSGEIALFRSAQQNLSTAIATAEQETGGKAFKAEFEDKRGVGVWEIGTLSDTARFKVGIDAANGQIVQKSEKRMTAPAAQGGQPAPVLADLVAKAETAGNGKVMSIEPEHRNGTMIGYEVKIVGADGRVAKYILNSADGSLAAKPRHKDRD